MRKLKKQLHQFSKQVLLFIDFAPKEYYCPTRRAIPQPVKFKKHEIKQVWTLYRNTDPNVRPELPFTPIHRVNAISEDYAHNWNLDNEGQFRYASRVTEDPVWVLVELK